MVTVMIFGNDERALVAAVQQALETVSAPRGAPPAEELSDDRVLDAARVDPFSFAGGQGTAARPHRSECSAGASIDAPATGPRSGALVSPMRGTFRLEGECWAVAFDGRALHLKDTKGMRYVAYLLSNPGKSFRALDVVATIHQGAAPEGNGGWTFEGSCEPVADRQALSAWRARLHELEEELEAAIACNDLGRIDKLRYEIEWLTQQIKAACGLNGRLRGMPSPTERARQMLTKGVCSAVRRIGHDHAELANHLARCIKTGRICGYEPEADRPVVWSL